MRLNIAYGQNEASEMNYGLLWTSGLSTFFLSTSSKNLSSNFSIEVDSKWSYRGVSKIFYGLSGLKYLLRGSSGKYQVCVGQYQVIWESLF